MLVFLHEMREWMWKCQTKVYFNNSDTIIQLKKVRSEGRNILCIHGMNDLYCLSVKNLQGSGIQSQLTSGKRKGYTLNRSAIHHRLNRQPHIHARGQLRATT